MFGWLKHKHASAPRDTAEATEHEDQEVSSHTSSGPIPDIAASEASATSTESASEQAYDKKGKDPKYKTKAWAQNRQYAQLDSNQRRMLDELNTGEGGELWEHLPVHLRAGFLNITAVIKGNGFHLDGLHLLPMDGTKNQGIQQDRLMFTPDSAGALKGPLDNAIAHMQELGDRGFMKDKPEEKLHPGMADWGGRQWVTQFSMQVGGGPAGAFVDIDEWGPKVDVVGTFGHLFEVLHNSTAKKNDDLGQQSAAKTDPFKVARGLDKRGDDP